MSKHLLSFSVLLLAGLLAALPAHSTLLSSDFSTQNGVCPTGSVSISYGAPFAPAWSVCGNVTGGVSGNIDSTGSTITAASLDSFLGTTLPTSSGGVVPMTGAAMQQTFTSGAGALTFQYTVTFDPAMGAYAFYVLDGTVNIFAENVPTVFSTAILPGISTPLASGSHTIGFGLVNGNAGSFDPLLSVINLAAPVPGVPEPSSMLMALTGLGFLIHIARRPSGPRA